MPTRKLHAVKELITSCDREKLCRQYLALYERPPEYTTVYLPYFMNKLYAIEPFPSSDHIVINTIVCEGGLDDLDTESYVFRIDDIVRFFEPIEAFDKPDQKAMFVNAVMERLPEKHLISGIGMAGFGRANAIRTRRVTDKLTICGDETTDVADGVGLTASRVMICAGHMAARAVEIILDT
jgi:hypothetical protein